MKSKQRFHPVVIFLLISTVFIKGGSFISWPFLTLLLKNQLGTSALVAGLVIGLSPLSSMLMSFYGGFLSDKLGRVRILYTSGIISAFAFASLTLATSWWHLAILNFTVGATTGALQTSIKALISDLTDKSNRARAFSLQYWAINVGASVGPLIGAFLLVKDSSVGFLLTGTLFFIFVILFFLLAHKYTKMSEDHIRSKKDSPVTLSFKDCIQILKKDNNFLLFLMGSITMAITYCQIETTLTLHLQNKMGTEGIKLFGYLMSCNSLIVICGLYPLTLISKKIGPLRSICWGQALMSVFFASMAFMGDSWSGLLIAMAFLTIGEILSFSNSSLVIDSLAKDGMKGTYFGASNLHSIGHCVGPALGGLLYQSYGSHVSFVILGMISLTGILFYLKAKID